MKQSTAFHKGIRRVWSRISAGSGTSRLGYSTVKQPRFTMHSPWSVVLFLVKIFRETLRLELGTHRLGVLHPNHYTNKNMLIVVKQIKASFNRQ